jgi:TolB protein
MFATLIDRTRRTSSMQPLRHVPNPFVSTVLLAFAVGVPLTQIGCSSGQKAEAELLTNIRQLTSSCQGLEKAGEAYFSPDGKTAIFQAVPTGKEQYQIYTIPTSGGTPTMVSTGEGACTCGYFRPDGKKIIFSSSHKDPRIEDPSIEIPIPGYKREGSRYSWDFNPYMDIYEADLDGSNMKPLTTEMGYDAEGAYSRDGKLIAFSSNRDGGMNLYTMKPDGSDVRQLTHDKNCYNGGPFVSPDGKHIIFRADRQKRDYLQIYLIDIDGSNEVQLTDNGEVNWAPYWYPDGKIIAFTTSLQGHSNYEIYLMDIETRKIRRVTHTPKFDGLPVFSNDGKMLMWTSQRSADGSSQIYVADFKLPHDFE